MIEINLLPGARKKRGGGAGFKLPDFKSITASVKDPWLIACVVGWVLVAGVIGIFYVPRRASVHALGPRLDSIEREARRLQEVLRTKAEAEAKRDTLQAQINVIRDIDRERYIWPHVMDAITRSLPPYTWLDEVAFRAGSDVDSGSALTLQITGKSADIQAVTRFVRNLEESPFLQNSVLVSTAVVREARHDLISYVISLQYQQPDTLLLTMQPLAASLVQGYRSGTARR